MLNEENIEKLEKVLNLQDLDEELKKVYEEMKFEALKAVNTRKNYIAKRREDPYQRRLNVINSQIAQARAKKDKEKLARLMEDHDKLIELHKKGVI